MCHVGGAGVGVLVDDRLKLLLSGLGSLFGRGDAWDVGLSWGSLGPQLSVHGANRLRKFEAGFFVLRAQVIPSADDGGENDGDGDYGNDQRGAVGDRPIGRFLGGVEGYTTEGILFQLMA